MELQLFRQRKVLLADGLEMGLDVVRPKFIDCPGDGKVFFAQILCGENLVGRELFDKKCPAAYLGRSCCRYCHRPPR